jgi:hypothetical protein
VRCLVPCGQAEAADRSAAEALSALQALPDHYRAFYGDRLLRRLQRALEGGAGAGADAVAA